MKFRNMIAKGLPVHGSSLNGSYQYQYIFCSFQITIATLETLTTNLSSLCFLLSEFHKNIILFKETFIKKCCKPSYQDAYAHGNVFIYRDAINKMVLMEILPCINIKLKKKAGIQLFQLCKNTAGRQE